MKRTPSALIFSKTSFNHLLSNFDFFGRASWLVLYFDLIRGRASLDGIKAWL
jgi:hypothetical protein